MEEGAEVVVVVVGVSKRWRKKYARCKAVDAPNPNPNRSALFYRLALQKRAQSQAPKAAQFVKEAGASQPGGDLCWRSSVSARKPMC